MQFRMPSVNSSIRYEMFIHLKQIIGSLLWQRPGSMSCNAHDGPLLGPSAKGQAVTQAEQEAEVGRESLDSFEIAAHKPGTSSTVLTISEVRWLGILVLSWQSELFEAL